MSTPIKQCPKCHTWAAVASHLHCKESPTCTWNKCAACKTVYDRYTGVFAAVTA